jgi:hypothetical protein
MRSAGKCVGGGVSLLLLAVAGLVLGVSAPAMVAAGTFELKGETTSILESWEDPASGKAALPFHQYLRLDLTETEGGGQRLALYGRLSADIEGRVDADSRLYHAWYEKKGIFTGADLRLGRQWVTTVAGSPVIDGALLKAPLWGHRLSVFGGGWVPFDDESPAALTWGAQLARDGANLGASLSYMQKWEGGDLAREYLGAEVSLAIPGDGKAYGEFQYDLLSGVFGWWLAGARFSPAARLSLRAEYAGSTPVFDSTSIFSVFAVDDYREASIKGDYRLDGGWTLFGGCTREFYREGGDSGVVEAGAELRRPRDLHGYLAGIWRTGEEDLSGIKVSVGAPVGLGVTADAGVEYDVYTRLGDEHDSDTSARRLWVEGSRPLGDDLALSFKFERIVSVVYDYYNRGRLGLTYRF